MYIKDILSLYSTSGEAEKDYRYLKTLIDMERIPKKDNVSSLDYLSEVFMCCLEQCKFLFLHYHDSFLLDHGILGILFKYCLHISKITLDNIRLGNSFVPLSDIVDKFLYRNILNENSFSLEKSRNGENFQKYRYGTFGSAENYTKINNKAQLIMEEEFSSLLNIKRSYVSLLGVNYSAYLYENYNLELKELLRLKRYIKRHFDELITSEEEDYRAKKTRTLFKNICGFFDIYRNFLYSNQVYDLDLSQEQMNNLLLAPDYLFSTLKQTLLLSPDLVCRFFIEKAQNQECDIFQAAKYISIPFARDYLIDLFKEDDGRIIENKNFFTIYVPFLSRLFFFTLLNNENCTFDKSYEKNSNLNRMLRDALSKCHSLSYTQAHFIRIIADMQRKKNGQPAQIEIDINSTPKQFVEPLFCKNAKMLYQDIFKKDFSETDNISGETFIIELYKYSQSTTTKPKYTDATYQQYLLDIAEFISEYIFSVPTALIPPLRKISFEEDHYDDYCAALHIHRSAYENDKVLLQRFFASKLLTFDEVCRDICITPSDLKALLDDGIIIGLKCGDEMLITQEALTEYIQKLPLEEQLKLYKLSKEKSS